MPRYAQVEKTIHGKLVSQHAFLHAICETLDLGKETGGKVNDLIPVLGPEWDTPERKKLLSATLVNMSRRGTIEAVEGHRGSYKASVYASRNGVSNFDSVEKSILQVIRDHGGFCRYRDIMEGHGVRVKGADAENNRNDPIYARINQVIEKSTLIRQDFMERGHYNLPWAELHGLPLTGRAISMMCKITHQEQCGDRWHDMSESERLSGWYAFREFQFTQIGFAFRHLRDTRNLSIADLLDAAPKIRSAVVKIEHDAQQEVSNVRQAWRDRTEVEVDKMSAAGASFQEIEAYKEGRVVELEDRTTEWMYGRFEDGQVGCHYYAPVGLYKAVAEFFGVCPAALSRGITVAEPFEMRLRPERTRRHEQDIVDARLKMEAEMRADRMAWDDHTFEADDLGSSAG